MRLKYLLTLFTLIFTTYAFADEAAEEPAPSPAPATTSAPKPNVRIVKPNRQQLIQGLSETILIFENFPKNQTLVLGNSSLLAKWPQRYQKTETIKINDKGMVIVNGGKKVQNFAVRSGGFALGERVYYRVADLKGNSLATFNFVPRPIEALGELKTFGIHAELAGINPTKYQLDFGNLEPNEKVIMRSMINGEKVEKQMIFHPGHAFVIVPDLQGQEGGVATVEFVRVLNGDRTSLDFNWGNKILEERNASK